MKKLLPLIFGLTLGCASNHNLSRLEIKNRELTLSMHPSMAESFRVPITNEIMNEALEEFQLLYLPLREQVKEIEFYPSSKSMPRAFVDHGGSKIYYYGFLPSAPVLAHEAAHIHQKVLGNDFYNRWNSNVDATIVYTGNDIDFPKNGFLHNYGAKKCNNCKSKNLERYHEDIATYVEDINEYFTMIKRANPKDFRFRNKLDLLCEGDFISAEQYEEALRVLGSEYRGQ